ncbi:hypothetical protein BJ980_002507 [Nocardioides daedukensis]|uniref:Immunity protein Imm1 n=2 Tax=Nocardioides daedukensis TaxID=634462 RepID=A0A7Y9S233_9ACTN|nr:hypothetical protein [Nocardioides daedukensis]
MFWESAEPPYFQSRGTGSADERIDFAYDGQETELPSSVLIGRELAVAALMEFADSGRRPDCVAWDET